MIPYTLSLYLVAIAPAPDPILIGDPPPGASRSPVHPADPTLSAVESGRVAQRKEALAGDPGALAAWRLLVARQALAEAQRQRAQAQAAFDAQTPPSTAPRPPRVDPLAQEAVTQRSAPRTTLDAKIAAETAATAAEFAARTAATAALTDASPKPTASLPDAELIAIVERAERRHEIADFYSSGSNGLSAAGLEGVLQVLGQVVVDKALESGWDLLARRLKALARCTDAPSTNRYPNVCKALTQDIHDLIAQPDILVSAAVLDLLNHTPGSQLEAELFTGFEIHWSGLAAAWRADRTRGVAAYLATAFQARIMALYTDHPTCPADRSLTLRAAWILGKCHDGLGTGCDLDALAKECKLDADQKIAVVATVSASGAGKQARDAVNTLFELERLRLLDAPKDLPPEKRATLDRQVALLGLLQDLVMGLLDQDTNRAMAAAAELAVFLLDHPATPESGPIPASKPTQAASARKTNQADDQLRKDTRAFFLILAAAARYATTQGTDAEKLAARKDVVKELITRLTRRANRTRGAVVSLGGSFGLVAGMRRAAGGDTGTGLASPLHLGLGMGLQTYNRRQIGGLHVELSPLDLGQYVVFTNQKLTVEKPDIKAAIAPTLKLGAHFGPKATPLYLAAILGLAPFVNETSESRMTWTIGLTFGVYVPFIDFN